MLTISENKSAYHNYDIKHAVEAGIKLTGSEVKSLRIGRVKLSGAHVKFIGNQVKLIGMRIGVYPKAADKKKIDPDRTRELLLNKTEISKFVGLDSQKGWAIVPLRIYFKNNLVKVEIGAGKLLKKYDKREKIKKREIERRIQRESGIRL